MIVVNTWACTKVQLHLSVVCLDTMLGMPYGHPNGCDVLTICETFAGCMGCNGWALKVSYIGFPCNDRWYKEGTMQGLKWMCGAVVWYYMQCCVVSYHLTMRTYQACIRKSQYLLETFWSFCVKKCTTGLQNSKMLDFGPIEQLSMQVII